MTYFLNSIYILFTNLSIPAACDSATTSSLQFPLLWTKKANLLFENPLFSFPDTSEKFDNAAYIPRASSPSEKPFKIRKNKERSEPANARTPTS
jgi:hypothetical protein